MDLKGQWKPLNKLSKRTLTLFTDLHKSICAVANKSSLFAVPDGDGDGFYEILYFDSTTVIAVVLIDSENQEIVVSMPLPPLMSSRVLESTPFESQFELECWEQFDAVTSGPNALTHSWTSSTIKTREEVVRITRIAKNWRSSLQCTICAELIPLEELEEVRGEFGYEYDLCGVRVQVKKDGTAVGRPAGFKCVSCDLDAWAGLDSYEELEAWSLSSEDAAVFRSLGVPASFLRDIATEQDDDFRFSSFEPTEIAVLFRTGLKPNLVVSWLESSAPLGLAEAILSKRPTATPNVVDDDEWLLPSSKLDKKRALERRFEQAHGSETWPTAARQLVERGVPVRTLSDWLCTGLDVDTVVEFSALGLAPDDFDPSYGSWTDWGLDLDDYIAWVRSIYAASKRLPLSAREIRDELPVAYLTWVENDITEPGEALAWFEAGFSPYLITEDGIEPYLKRGLDVEQATALRRAWRGRLPREWDSDDLEFSDYMDVTDAMFWDTGKAWRGRLPREWDSNDLKFSDYMDAANEMYRDITSDNYAEWFALPPSLIGPVVERSISPRSVVYFLQNISSYPLNFSDDGYLDWGVVIETIAAVLEVGLPMSADNVTAWLGCRADEILRAIDAGVTTKSMKLLKRGLTQAQADAYDALTSGGLDDERAMSAVRQGFELQFLDLWEGEGLSGAIKYFRNSPGGLGAGTSLADVFAWWKAGFSTSSFHPTGRLDSSDKWRSAGYAPSDARTWFKAGFSAASALEWKDGGFTARTAKPWIDAGISGRRARAWRERGVDPEVAQRREQAGLSP